MDEKEIDILKSTASIASMHTKALCDGIKKMSDEIARLKKLTEGLVERIAGQSELLSKKAEKGETQ